jgi:sugar-specific transcriptional regulator TrmB
MQATSLRDRVRRNIPEKPGADEFISNDLFNMDLLRKVNIDNVQAINYRDVIQILSRFKLSKTEIKTYIFLARAGMQRAQVVAENIGVLRADVYKILRGLESYGLISKVLDKPMRFEAKPFEEVLDSVIDERRKQIVRLESRKNEILEAWQSLPRAEVIGEVKENIQVLEGKRQIIMKINELVKRGEKEVLLVLRDSELVWLYNSLFFEDVKQVSKFGDVQVKLITNFSATSEYVLDRVDPVLDFYFIHEKCEVSFVVRDDSEVLLLMNNDEKPMGLYTNFKAMVVSLRLLFKSFSVRVAESPKKTQNKLTTSVPF